MTKILLVRHGHVEGIKPERFRGRQDIPLSEQGLTESRTVAQYIALHWHPTAIYASPLQRCVRTGEEIALRCGTYVRKIEELQDLDYGDWQWRTHAEVNALWPEQSELWRKAPHRMRFPQGESLQDLSKRVADCLRLILQRHENETVIVVGHDSGNRVLLLELLGMPLSAYWHLAQDPCGVSEIDVSAHGAKAIRINETQHIHTGSK